jgi:hypothetical protein
LKHADRLAAAIIQKVGKAIGLALPLGKANHAYDPAIAICLGAAKSTATRAKEPSRRFDVSAGNLAAWNIDPSDFPRNGTAAEKARFAVPTPFQRHRATTPNRGGS